MKTLKKKDFYLY